MSEVMIVEHYKNPLYRRFLHGNRLRSRENRLPEHKVLVYQANKKLSDTVNKQLNLKRNEEGLIHRKGKSGLTNKGISRRSQALNRHRITTEINLNNFKKLDKSIPHSDWDLQEYEYFKSLNSGKIGTISKYVDRY